jgi:segregation and condensation protein B
MSVEPAMMTIESVDEFTAEVELDAEPMPLPRIELDAEQLQRIIEGSLLAAGKPLTIDDIAILFDDADRPTNDAIRAALTAIAEQCAGRGFELREVASGFRFQVVQEVAPWIARLWEEKPQRYSRALLETLALIAYRQPITRGDIEDIRGVAVATNIIKTLLEREWVRVVGHKDVPGRPALYATTRKFLDYFNLQNLDDLPTLAEIRDLDSFNVELALEGIDTVHVPDQTEAEAGETARVENGDAVEIITVEVSETIDVSELADGGDNS